MKYDSLRKTKRDKELIAYALKHPELSYEEIGQKFGIKHGAVSRVCIRQGIRRRPSGFEKQKAHIREHTIKKFGISKGIRGSHEAS